MQVAAGPSPTLSVIFFDVGHGDASLVRFPNGKTLLIDAGPAFSGNDAGTRFIYPFLERWGIRTLDAVLITHPHADHLGGLPSILSALPVRRVLMSPRSSTRGLPRRLLRLADSLDVPLRYKAAGDTLSIDPTVRLRILAPDAALALHPEVNETSLVVQVQYGATAFLFLGDAESESERFLTRHYSRLLRSDVVKVGHHGSRTSSSAEVVDRIVPDEQVDGADSLKNREIQSPIAIVSTGPSSVYGLPDEDVLDRWEAHGAQLHVTANQRALWLSSDGHSVSPIPW
jgi:competence protein ComEC